MIIHRMAASFGRLEKETLTLRPGLNIIEAPNEWGKSTWCAFLRCMFYGVDTTQREKAGYKPDKLRYAPWSGAPMTGAMELDWRGERIALRRSTRLPNAPMREFAAVYGETGEPVPGLHGGDAGEILLGVPEAVYRRTAFIPQGGLRFTSGGELEKKLSALVSTGEEDVSYTQAAEQLYRWQRARRWRSKGRLPEIEAQLQHLTQQLIAVEELQGELAGVEKSVEILRNKREQFKSRRNTERLSRREEALIALEKAQDRQRKLEDMALQRTREAQERLRELEKAPFAGADPQTAATLVESAVAAAGEERRRVKPGWLLPMLLIPGMALMGAGFAWYPWLRPVALGAFALGLIAGGIFAIRWRNQRKGTPKAFEIFGVTTEEDLRSSLQRYTAAWRAAQAAERLAEQVRQEAETARMEYRQTQQRVLAEPESTGAEETLLAETEAQLQQLRELWGGTKARLDAIGDPMVLKSHRRQLEKEAEKLEKEYAAMELALQELEAADRQLRSEFSPQLARRTAHWLSQLTGGRYSEVTLDRELHAMVSSREELIPRESTLLSQGTADQVYLALRLALCELVLPEDSPIVLDDALLSFDDQRLGYALEALLKFSEHRQVLLFTCQDRENRYIKNRGGAL